MGIYRNKQTYIICFLRNLQITNLSRCNMVQIPVSLQKFSLRGTELLVSFSPKIFPSKAIPGTHSQTVNLSLIVAKIHVLE